MGTVEIGWLGWLGTGWEREKPSRERELEQRSLEGTGVARGWRGGWRGGWGWLVMVRKCREQRAESEKVQRVRAERRE
jgi:hypothetical protein